jgi:hypothetical protein
VSDWPFSSFEWLLGCGRALINISSTEIFCQASDCFPALRFVLDAIESAENPRVGFRATHSRGEPGNGIEANSWRASASMGDSDFHAVGEALEGDFQARTIRGQMLKSFRTGGDHRRLQSSSGVALKSGNIGQITDDASGGGSQAHVGIEEQAESF